MKARSAKAKGTKLEVETVKSMEACGLTVRRQPGSGIYSDFPHDVQLMHCGKRYIVECKARKNGFKTLENWRKQADLLVIKADREPPMVYMSLRLFAEMVGDGS